MILALLAEPSWAYKLEGWAYPREEFPLTWAIAADPGTSPPDFFETSAANALSRWSTADACAPIPIREVESCDTADLCFRWTPVPWDFSGTGAGNDELFERDGVIVRENRTFEIDIPTNLPVVAASGQCHDAYVLDALLAHDIGHALGLGHSCDDGEPCTAVDDPMKWDLAPCSDPAVTLDDIAAIDALYGPWVEAWCTPYSPDPESALFPSDAASTRIVEDGDAPYVMWCRLRNDGVDLRDITWDFGDGGTAEGFEVAHTYADAGRFTVRADASGFVPACGLWERIVSAPDALSCERPQPRFHVEGVGRTLSLVNDTPDSPIGCVDRVHWDVKDASGATVADIISWNAGFTAPADGTYTVVLRLGGQAGAGEAAEVVRVGHGCDSTGAGGPWWLALAALVRARGRRR